MGWSLRPVALRELAGKVAVYDLFGRPESHPSHGGDLHVMVNEAVRYVMVPAAYKAQALESLRKPTTVATMPAK
jgi:citrate lyase beta subunit